MKKLLPYLSWALRIVAAGILLQTLYFKFTAHPDSVHIFSALGVEPWGRIALGIFELITAILILLPTTVWLGGLLGVGLMVGAIGSHFLVLGVEVNEDGGGLFTLAVVTLLACLGILWIHRTALKQGLNRIIGKRTT